MNDGHLNDKVTGPAMNDGHLFDMLTNPGMNDGHLYGKVTDPGMNDGHLNGECAPYVSLGNGEGEDGAFARLEAHNLRPASVSCV